MKTLAYIWNDELLSINSQKIITIRLEVTTRMMQSVINKSKARGWQIEKKGLNVLSNRMRSTAIMTYTNSIHFVHNVLQNLELAKVSNGNTHEYYRFALEVNRQSYIPYQFILFNASTGVSRYVQNTPFKVESIQCKGSGSNGHFLARRIKQ